MCQYELEDEQDKGMGKNKKGREETNKRRRLARLTGITPFRATRTDKTTVS
jgi:hypothetical protein